MAKPEVARSLKNGGSREMVSRQIANAPVMTRVDAPHEVPEFGRESAAEEPVPAAVVKTFVPDESVSEQISLQAAQLGSHLRVRQEELDHREAELNSRIAHLESDARAARLWLDQHETDLVSRSEDLAQQRRDLMARSEAIARCEEELAQRSQKLSDRELEVAGRERDSERRLARLAAVEASLQKRVSVSDEARVAELEHAAKAVELRQRRLDDAERRLTDSQAETKKLCDQLAADHADFAKQSAMLHDQIAAERRQAMAEIEEKRQAVQGRAERVDQRWTALKQLRSELGRIHRETLEIRLATEELWAQLSGVAPPATLTRSLGRIRAKLAEQYAQASSETADQRNELEAIRVQLIAQHEKLIEQKRQFERWAAGCQEDCQEQATRLIAREQQLHDREIELRHQFQRWQAERLRYQIELRRLQSQGIVAEEITTLLSGESQAVPDAYTLATAE